MLSCDDLDGFVDRLCDLTRQMPGTDRIREAGELLRQIEQVPQRFVMEWRAAETADQHYLCGRSLRSMATEQGLSFQAVSFWLQNHGPRHYMAIQRMQGPIDEDPFFSAQLIKVEGEETKLKVKKFRAAGRRVVPATFNVIDPGQPNWLSVNAPDLAQLWDMTGEWEALQRDP